MRDLSDGTAAAGAEQKFDVGASHAYRLTAAELDKRRVRIVNGSPTRDFIETDRTVYYIAAASRFDETSFLSFVLQAIASGKRFAWHALAYSSDVVETKRSSLDAIGKELNSCIATDDRSIVASVARFETVPLTQRLRAVYDWCIADGLARRPNVRSITGPPLLIFATHVAIGDVVYLMVTLFLGGIVWSEISGGRPIDPKIAGFWLVLVAVAKAVFDLSDNTLARLKRIIDSLRESVSTSTTDS